MSLVVYTRSLVTNCLVCLPQLCGGGISKFVATSTPNCSAPQTSTHLTPPHPLGKFHYSLCTMQEDEDDDPYHAVLLCLGSCCGINPKNRTSDRFTPQPSTIGPRAIMLQSQREPNGLELPLLHSYFNLYNIRVQKKKSRASRYAPPTSPISPFHLVNLKPTDMSPTRGINTQQSNLFSCKERGTDIYKQTKKCVAVNEPGVRQPRTDTQRNLRFQCMYVRGHGELRR